MNSQPQPLIDELTEPDPLGQYSGRQEPAFGTKFFSVKLTDTRLKS